MNLVAVDPGSEQSASVWISPLPPHRPIEFSKQSNSALLEELKSAGAHGRPGGWDHLAIEMIASYGMPVGAEVFDTCVWIGRFIQAWGGPYTLVYRREVKMFLCGNNTAKDGNIRQALIDRYGGKAKAIGKKTGKTDGVKNAPGPLYGISDDVWSALAVAVTWQGTHGKLAA